MVLKWHIFVIVAMGFLGGLVETWDPKWANFKGYSCFVGILFEGQIWGMCGRIHILNTYAPYKYRTTFCDRLYSFGIMELASLILTSNLSYTIALEEVWGSTTWIDPMVGMFHDALLTHNFIDIYQMDMAPTWDNGNAGEAYVAKRLDGFLMHEELFARFTDV